MAETCHAIMANMKTRRNFHAPLPEDPYEGLRHASEETARSATTLAREAITEWLERRERDRLARELARYAAATAGGPKDLGEELESASLETWDATV